MTQPLSVVHVIARLGATGPTRSLAALVKFGQRSGQPWAHTIVVLETGVAPMAVLWLRREGAKLIVSPSISERDEMLGRADVVIVHYWNCPSIVGFLATSTVDSRRAPRVVWVHTLGVHPPQVLASAVVESGDELWLSTAATRSAPSVQGLEAMGAMAVIPGLIDPDRLESYRPIPHDGTVIGYVGTINRQKIHPRFVELCTAIAEKARADVRFTVVGTGGDEQEIRNAAAELGLGDRFTVPGHVDDVAAALGSFDVFGYPLGALTYASSDLSVQEAMWVGLPPVVFDVGGLADIIVRGETGLVTTSDDDYVNCVCLLIGDRGLRERLGQGARAHARTNFDPLRSVAQVAERLAMTIDRHRHRHDPPPGNALFGPTPAHWFASSLGSHGDAFRRSLENGGGGNPLAECDGAPSQELLIRGEGGLFQWRNAYPTEVPLLLWSAFVLETMGDDARAASERASAAVLRAPTAPTAP
jgi:glycosyltransferase involved in cell wall biosynthesis